MLSVNDLLEKREKQTNNFLSDMMTHACNFSTWEAEAGGSKRVQSQPGLHSKILSLKRKKKSSFI
jgi:hypothetical protein